MTSSYRLMIELESDLCSSSGDGFSGGIDTDVRYDASGLPYLPGRTIKGCLREAARFVCGSGDEATEEISRLYGRRGGSESGAIVVHRARICLPNGEPVVVPPGQETQRILNVFTYQRANTALVPGEGHVQENSLRYTRVMKQYNPMTTYDPKSHRLGSLEDADKLLMIALIEAPEAYEDLLRKSAKAMRALGMNRNRGLGAVSCKIERCEEPLPNTVSWQHDGSARVEYRVRLDSPLMLAQSKGTSSAEYVPGYSVLGYFASRFKGDSKFDDMFLQNKVVFSPLYPVGADSERCKPASSLVVKAKSISNNVEDGTYWSATQVGSGPVEGTTYKPCKAGFVDSAWHPIKVRTETFYHHSTGRSAVGDEATLYTQKCLCEGQELAGYIESSDPELLKAIVKAMRHAGDGALSFGRSKSAEYARCSLVDVKNEAPGTCVSVKKGLRYAFLLDSDALLVDGKGRVSASYEALKAAIMAGLSEKGGAGVFVASDAETVGEGLDEEEDVPITNLSYRTIMGYNAKWNQKKPHVRALAAGSVVVFEAMCDAELPSEFVIGLRRSEGFGRVLVVDPSVIGNENGEVFSAKGVPEACVEPNEALVALLDVEADKESLRKLALRWARDHKTYFSDSRLNPAFVGRLGRMIDEATSWEDLLERIKSIKTETKKRDSLQLIEGFHKDDEVASERERLVGKLSKDATWPVYQGCLALITTLGKYFGKQDSQPKEANDD